MSDGFGWLVFAVLIAAVGFVDVLASWVMR